MNMSLLISLLLLIISILFVYCWQYTVNMISCAESDEEVTTKSKIKTPIVTDTKSETELKEPALSMTVNGISLDVIWENNGTVTELFNHTKKNGSIIISTKIYGGFEQVGSLPQSFSGSDVQMTTQPGDIVLYSGDQLVIFFGTNSWLYTKLGHINLANDELTKLLSGNTTTIKISAP